MLMTGVDSSINVLDLHEVVAGFLGSVAFEIARVDATSVVILPVNIRDVILLEELLLRVVDIIKRELVGVFSNVTCCWGTPFAIYPLCILSVISCVAFAVDS